jgi:hypothetical protein
MVAPDAIHRRCESWHIHRLRPVRIVFLSPKTSFVFIRRHSPGSETVILKISTQNRRCQVRVTVLLCYPRKLTENGNHLGRHRWVDFAQVSH